MSNCPNCSSKNTNFRQLSSTATNGSFVTGGKSDPNKYIYHYGCRDCQSEFAVEFHQGALKTIKK